MASTTDLEDTLPLVDPDCDRYTDVLGKKYAVYSLIQLDDEGRQRLVDDLNNAEESLKNCRLAPQANFAGHSLREIYDYHMQIREQDDTVHPLYFIVADQNDWETNGVLMIYTAVGTDRSDPANVVGVGRCGVDMADLIGANLDIGNVDWVDYKVEEEEQWGGDDPYENKRYFQNLDKPAVIKFPHYFWYSLVKKMLPITGMLEPNWVYMKPGEQRLQSAGDFHASEDPWPEIRKQFPYDCLRKNDVHRQLFLVAEKEDADTQEGIAICQAEWDGDLSAFTYDATSHEGREQDRNAVESIRPEIIVIRKVKASVALAELDQLAEQLGK